MTVSFSSQRSDAIRAGLIGRAAPRSRRSQTWRGTALVLAGALAGGGVSAVAFAAAGARPAPVAQPSGQPVPSLGAAIPAPAGVIPGSPIISLLGAPVTQAVNAAATTSLKSRPALATHARVTITPTKAGSLSFGTDPAGNNPSGSWTVDDIASGHGATWYDFPLDASVSDLHLRPAGGFAGAITIQYLHYVPTQVGVNARGQTYGVSGSGDRGEPDLVAVEATNGKAGYANATDLQGTMPTSPADAVAQQQANQGRRHTIPVFESDGTTVIGEFSFG